ncbi:uncharacterized protein LOC135196634 [Macrobrachium nipponense]|uniref:uncharacterized protein LOC135196634 n=1 Tax=Macrobrachium nipponense TaxID=159736 RepID=UPI0030C7BAEB
MIPLIAVLLVVLVADEAHGIGLGIGGLGGFGGGFGGAGGLLSAGNYANGFSHSNGFSHGSHLLKASEELVQPFQGISHGSHIGGGFKKLGGLGGGHLKSSSSGSEASTKSLSPNKESRWSLE